MRGPTQRCLCLAVLVLLMPSPVLGSDLTCDLVRVVDGDTVELRCGGIVDTIRLLRIDTPERAEPGFEVAAQALREFLGEGPVGLEYELAGEPKRGTYDRLLGYLIVDGKVVNIEMVRAGWSRFWTKYGAGRYADDFERAEEEAEAANRGIWAEPQPLLSGTSDPERSFASSCRPRASCCRVCESGRACGNSCISASKTCRKGTGCACNGAEVCR